MDNNNHTPVLLSEAIQALEIKSDHWYIDGTFGRGGHTRQILNQGGKVIAFDVDHMAIEYGQRNFAKEIDQGQLILIRENFDKIKTEVQQLKRTQPDTLIHGILFDFGTSTPQLQSVERGFSFSGSGDLDMRMDNRLGVKAKDLLMILSEKQLAELFAEVGGEHEARSIAKAVVRIRASHPEELSTTSGLADLIVQTKRERRSHLHPATKVFQALRIAVNSELDSIQIALPQALEVLQPGEPIVTIAFHEGEDRIVKTLFIKWQEQKLGTVVTKHPVTAGEEELNQNLKARSAKLRIFKKNSGK